MGFLLLLANRVFNARVLDSDALIAAPVLKADNVDCVVSQALPKQPFHDQNRAGRY